MPEGTVAERELRAKAVLLRLGGAQVLQQRDRARIEVGVHIGARQVVTHLAGGAGRGLSGVIAHVLDIAERYQLIQGCPWRPGDPGARPLHGGRRRRVPDPNSECG